VADGGRDADGSEEVCRASIVASGDALKVFQPAKHPLDRVSVSKP
jgi:hypothetical protein